MKRILLLIVVLFCFCGYSQDEIKLASKDNVFITYHLTKLSETEKKDKYLISVTCENKNKYDLFYALQVIKDANGKEIFNPNQPSAYSSVNIRNATGFFNSKGTVVQGQVTSLRTENNESLVGFEKQKIYNFETEFTVKHGDVPLITNSYLLTLRQISDFNLMLDDNFVNGVWISSCGNNVISLAFVNVDNGKVLLQSVNCKQI